MFDPQPFDREKHVYRCDEFSELLKDAVRFFHGTPVCNFPPEKRFVGAGVYALYYIGKTGCYAKFGQEINREEYRPRFMSVRPSQRDGGRVAAPTMKERIRSSLSD